MLVLTRRLDESILLTGGIKITVLGIRYDRVRIGIEAPTEVSIAREELLSQLDESRISDLTTKSNGNEATKERQEHDASLATDGLSSKQVKGGEA